MFPLDDNFVFGDIFFCGWYFFFGRRQKKILSQQKKILTNKRSYSSNGNTFMPMIWSFYANPFLYFFGGTKTFLKCWGFCSEPTIKEISKMSALSVLRHKKLKFQWYLPLCIENKQYSDCHMKFKSQAPFKHFQGLHNSYTGVSSITLNKKYDCYGLNYHSITRGTLTANINCERYTAWT